MDSSLTNETLNLTGDSHGNSLAVTVGLTLANVVAIVGGTLGNSLVILVVVINRSMHSSTNYFISSLAAADLIVTSICMPLFFVYNVLTWPVWPFGRTACRVLSYLVHVSVMASALSLLSISYDRCLSIFFPLKRLVTLSRAKKVIALIWFVSPLLLLPSLLHHDVVSTEHAGKKAVMCVESWDTIQQLHAYQMYRVSCYFLFVLQITVVYCLIGRSLYKRKQPGEQTAHSEAKAQLSKRKVLRMLFLVVTMFSLSWLPYIINKLLNMFPPERSYKSPDVFVFIGNFLALLNSVANPVVYAVLNQTYRTAFRYAIRCKCNFETEERRRALSKSLRNGRSSSKSQMRRQRSMERRKSSLSTEVFVLPGDENDKTRPVRCLSFVKTDIALNDLSKTGANGFRSNGMERRRVSFGGELLTKEEGNFVNCAIKEEEFEEEFPTARPGSASGDNSLAHVNESFET